MSDLIRRAKFFGLILHLSFHNSHISIQFPMWIKQKLLNNQKLSPLLLYSSGRKDRKVQHFSQNTTQVFKFDRQPALSIFLATIILHPPEMLCYSLQLTAAETRLTSAVLNWPWRPLHAGGVATNNNTNMQNVWIKTLHTGRCATLWPEHAKTS